MPTARRRGCWRRCGTPPRLRPAGIRTSRPRRCGARLPVFTGSRRSRSCSAAARAKSCARPSTSCGSAEKARHQPCRRSSRLADGPERAGAEVVGVRVSRDYTHDLDAMLARIDAETRLVYICNPNNPTGRLTGRRDLEVFLRKLPAACVVLMDEAYHHYAAGSPDYSSFIDRPVDDEPRDRHAHVFQDLWTGGIACRVCRCRGPGGAGPRCAHACRWCECRCRQSRRRGARRQRARADERHPEHRRPAGVLESGDRANAPAGFPDQLRHD